MLRSQRGCRSSATNYLHRDVDLSDDSDNHGGVHDDEHDAGRFLALSRLIGDIRHGHKRKKLLEKITMHRCSQKQNQQPNEILPVFYFA